ncbi:ferric reductase [Arcobacter sp. CECT 8989]|uniref:sulfite oxidase heme-binding subunit YedZ n=1 Tax=Arcobacter sp. CECT 8989 TaxID=2044509 RepID=UPI00100B7F0D|nr:ferric reductase-like transmembrane domain-containing protein [Arcobacter sp. CECT 8989]RXJ97996.1 ferric reductase [Arcobacter sp. CECT 8989]
MKRFLLFLLLLTPFIFASYELFLVQIVKDPIKYIYTISGVTATVILFFTICISLIKKHYNLIKYRRMIGLYGFFYALVHFLNFVVLDAELDINFLIKETIDKPFIYLGMIAFLILVFMAITSTNRLFRIYHSYHKLIYLSLILITIHFIMAQKSLTLIEFSYIGIIILIGYWKLLQQIIKRNKV